MYNLLMIEYCTLQLYTELYKYDTACEYETFEKDIR